MRSQLDGAWHGRRPWHVEKQHAREPGDFQGVYQSGRPVREGASPSKRPTMAPWPRASARVKGAKRTGARTGNWLTQEQAEALLHAPGRIDAEGKRDQALLAVLIDRKSVV